MESKKAGFDPNKIERSLQLSGGLEYYYAFNINTPDSTVDKFNDALNIIKNNGAYEKIVTKYGRQ